jgi:hypothetical protein
MQALFDERLGRYQAAIALEPTDRVPIATGANYFAEIYSGNNNQETIYNPEKWLQAELQFVKAFPETDVLRDNRVYAPLFDAIGLKTYKLPGRDLPPDAQFQFVETQYMMADEYDYLIQNPLKFMFERWYPRLFGEFAEPGSVRSYLAFLKAGMAQAQAGAIMRNRAAVLEHEAGMPQPMNGFFLAPFDVLADAMRGLRGAFMDCFKQPQKVLAACDALVPEMANLALMLADPLRRWPIFVPTHKPVFMTPQQFDKFYWPSFKKVVDILIGAGHTVRAMLEGDWSPYWHHLLEFPKGTVLCDIDGPADIFKAKKEIGYHQCISGGLKDSQFILGTPDEMRAAVKHLCETVAEGGGFIINGGCNIPYTTKAENYRAMIDAILEFGVYDKNCHPRPKSHPAGSVTAFSFPRMMTSWETRKAEIGGVQGEEALIRKPWEQLESLAYVWLWQWVL